MNHKTQQPPPAQPPTLERPRRVLIVGATGRLGAAISRALVQRGDHVALTARDPVKLDALARDLGALTPNKPRVVCADLRAPSAPIRIARELINTGGLDDLVLAGGTLIRTPLQDLRREDLVATLNVHAVAPLLLASALGEELARRRGAIIGLSDSGVSRPYLNHSAYLMAKGALQTGLLALATELAPRVRVNVLALGAVAEGEADQDPVRSQRIASRSPLGRFGTTAEVVHAVIALLDATWVTGEVWGVGR